MKKQLRKKSQHKTIFLGTADAQLAEHVRLLHKELSWCLSHLSAIYDIIKPEDAPEIEDPNQLKLFEN
jgi:hypothetical protein